MNFDIVCPCCSNKVLMSVKNASIALWKAAILNNQFSSIACPDCGCEHRPADNGQSIGQQCIARPKITGLSVVSGTPAGGTSVIVTGHALSKGDLIVKFNGVPSTNMRNKSDSSVTVDTPPGKVGLLAEKDSYTGTLSEGDVVVGDISGHTATVVISSPYMLLVTNPSGAFAGGEWLKKDNDNKIKLAPTNYWRGSVDVTVENELGHRAVGHKLASGFTYTF